MDRKNEKDMTQNQTKYCEHDYPYDDSKYECPECRNKQPDRMLKIIQQNIEKSQEFLNHNDIVGAMLELVCAENILQGIIKKEEKDEVFSDW